MLITKKKHERQVGRLLDKIKEKREIIEAHNQLAKVHSAYITILLQKLGATEGNMITITASEVKEALEKYEARAVQADDGYSLYCEVVNKE